MVPVSAELKAIADSRGGSTVRPDGCAGHSPTAVSPSWSLALRDHVVDGSRALRAGNLRRVCGGVIDALAEPERALLTSLDGAPTTQRWRPSERSCRAAGKSASWRAELDARDPPAVDRPRDGDRVRLHRVESSRLEQRIATEKRLSSERIAADLDARSPRCGSTSTASCTTAWSWSSTASSSNSGSTERRRRSGHLAMPERVREVIHVGGRQSGQGRRCGDHPAVLPGHLLRRPGRDHVHVHDQLVRCDRQPDADRGRRAGDDGRNVQRSANGGPTFDESPGGAPDRQDRAGPGSLDDRQASVATGSRRPSRCRGRVSHPSSPADGPMLTQAPGG